MVGEMWEGYDPPSPAAAACQGKGHGHYRCLSCKRLDLHLDDVDLIDDYEGTALCFRCREQRALARSEGLG